MIKNTISSWNLKRFLYGGKSNIPKLSFCCVCSCTFTKGEGGGRTDVPICVATEERAGEQTENGQIK